MSLQSPFSLRIFVADGDPDGLRIVDKSNWIGKALVFPRALLPRVKAWSEVAYRFGCHQPCASSTSSPPCNPTLKASTPNSSRRAVA